MLIQSGSTLDETWAQELNKTGDFGHGCKRVRLETQMMLGDKTQEEYHREIDNWKALHPEWKMYDIENVKPWLI
jgi:hypothetical protein